MDSGTESILSKFTNDAELCGSVDRQEGRDGIQRDLDRFERWACVNLMKFDKAKCKVLHLGQGNPKPQVQTGWRMDRVQPWRKRLWGVGQEAQHVSAMCTCSPESQQCSGLYRKQITGDDFSPLLYSECRPQFAFTWRGVQYTWNRLPQGWKHSPTICHGLIQAALEQDQAPEHLQYIDDIIV
ncbi:hypothetical protein HGM15179_018117 [Zosterops borbonicus]|uniref:ribonuclease H n=1 Tax=Zosterops borbonicus TaxID=364589 RepID=A0A8K1FZN7_9PASS|nr:hypothetical protein HGM15179_018117 [Zosterops borbonicus]